MGTMEPLVYQQDQNSDDVRIPAIRIQLQNALQATYGLTLLRHVLQESTGQAVLDLLHTLADSNPEPVAVAQAYSHAFHALAEGANDEVMPALADAWQAYLAGRLIDDRNPWSEQVERLRRLW